MDTCPYCKGNVVTDDTYDIDESSSEVTLYKIGHCENCQTEIQWQEIFVFDRVENIEKAS